MLDEYNPVKMEIFVLMFLSTVVLVYCAVIVIMFIRETRNGQQMDSFDLDTQEDDDDKSPLVSRQATLGTFSEGMKNESSTSYKTKTPSGNLSKQQSAYSYRAF